MKKHSKEDVLKLVSEEIKDINNLYKANRINWKGKTKENEDYSEVIAEKLLKEEIKGKLSKIPEICREENYNRSHDGKTQRKTNRQEEIFAKELFNSKREFINLGKIIEYQIPLKNKRSDKGVGKIDLISYSEKPQCVFIIELKFGNNNETLLRAILEIATYYQILCKKKFLKDYEFSNMAIKKAVLLCEGSNSFNEAKDLNKRPQLRKLIEELDVKIFLMNYNTEEIELL